MQANYLIYVLLHKTALFQSRQKNYTSDGKKFETLEIQETEHNQQSFTRTSTS